MMRLRSLLLMRTQLAISASVRPQPRHSPAWVSSVQIFTHGLSIVGWFIRELVGAHHRADRAEHNRREGRSRQVPALKSGCLRMLDRSALAPGSAPCLGWVGGASIGAIAATTRSGGKVTMTSVPIRSLDLSVNVPP